MQTTIRATPLPKHVKRCGEVYPAASAILTLVGSLRCPFCWQPYQHLYTQQHASCMAIRELPTKATAEEEDHTSSYDPRVKKWVPTFYVFAVWCSPEMCRGQLLFRLPSVRRV